MGIIVIYMDLLGIYVDPIVIYKCMLERPMFSRRASSGRVFRRGSTDAFDSPRIIPRGLALEFQ